MISINLGKAIYTIETNGFNMVLSQEVGLKGKDLYLVKNVADVTMIQTGQLINVYALFLAVFGSFFLIYASEDGADSLDMVFNSLALFFLIELDDLLVQDNDYQDVQTYVQGRQQELEEKAAKLDSIAEESQQAGASGVTEDLQNATETKLICCSFPCTFRCFKRYEKCSDAFQYVVVIIVYVAAIIGPFAVSLCW